MVEEVKQTDGISGIQLISDIHLEFGIADKMPQIKNNDYKSTVLALLGDIGYANDDNYKQFIHDMSKKYKYVLIITGNHEYYSNEIYTVHNILHQIDQKYKNVFFLHKRCIEFPEMPEIRFIGCTLWAKFEPHLKQVATKYINDFHHINIDEKAFKQDINIQNDPIQTVEQKIESDNKQDINQTDIDNKHRQLTVDDTNKMYDNQLKWIKHEIIRAKQDNKYLVILTHHAPTSYKCIHSTDERREMGYKMCFTSLEHLCVSPVIGWMFGHTHKNCDFTLVTNKTNGSKWYSRIASNQLGYWRQYKQQFEGQDFVSSHCIKMSDQHVGFVKSKQCITMDLMKQKQFMKHSMLKKLWKTQLPK
eukprot:424684_1